MTLITNTLNLIMTGEDPILDGQLVYRLEASDHVEITKLMKEWLNDFVEVIDIDSEDHEGTREDMIYDISYQYVMDLDTHWPVPDGIFVDDWSIEVEGDNITMEPILWEFV